MVVKSYSNTMKIVYNINPKGDENIYQVDGNVCQLFSHFFFTISSLQQKRVD